MRSWQKPLLPRSAAMCSMSVPDEYVPWTKTIGRWFLSQSAAFTTTGQSSAYAGGVPAEVPSEPASGEPLLEEELLQPSGPRDTSTISKEIVDGMIFMDVSSRAARVGRRPYPTRAGEFKRPPSQRMCTWGHARQRRQKSTASRSGRDAAPSRRRAPELTKAGCRGLVPPPQKGVAMSHDRITRAAALAAVLASVAPGLGGCSSGGGASASDAGGPGSSPEASGGSDGPGGTDAGGSGGSSGGSGSSGASGSSGGSSSGGGADAGLGDAAPLSKCWPPIPIIPWTSPYAGWSRGLPTDPGFFPIAVWLQGPWHAAEMHQLGINVFVGNSAGTDPLAASDLATLADGGIYAIVGQDSVGLANLGSP